MFDCSELFPDYEKADCEVTDNFAVIRLWQSGTYSTIGMNVDKVQNFLERCRANQEPRFYHLAEPESGSLIPDPKTLC